MTVPDPPWKQRTRPCPFYSQGRCLFSDSCNFLHDVKVQRPRSAISVPERTQTPVGYTSAISTHASLSPSSSDGSALSPTSVRSSKHSPRLSSLLLALGDAISTDEDDDDGDLEEPVIYVEPPPAVSNEGPRRRPDVAPDSRQSSPDASPESAHASDIEETREDTFNFQEHYSSASDNSSLVSHREIGVEECTIVQQNFAPLRTVSIVSVGHPVTLPSPYEEDRKSTVTQQDSVPSRVVSTVSIGHPATLPSPYKEEAKEDGKSTIVHQDLGPLHTVSVVSIGYPATLPSLYEEETRAARESTIIRQDSSLPRTMSIASIGRPTTLPSSYEEENPGDNETTILQQDFDDPSRTISVGRPAPPPPSASIGLLSPIEILEHPKCLPDHVFQREDSVDSGYADNWVGPTPFSLSPPRSPRPMSILSLLSSPFGSPSRVLAHHLSGSDGTPPPAALFSPHYGLFSNSQPSNTNLEFHSDILFDNGEPSPADSLARLDYTVRSTGTPVLQDDRFEAALDESLVAEHRASNIAGRPTEMTTDYPSQMDNNFNPNIEEVSQSTNRASATLPHPAVFSPQVIMETRRPSLRVETHTSAEISLDEDDTVHAFVDGYRTSRLSNPRSSAIAGSSTSAFSGTPVFSPPSASPSSYLYDTGVPSAPLSAEATMATIKASSHPPLTLGSPFQARAPRTLSSKRKPPPLLSDYDVSERSASEKHASTKVPFGFRQSILDRGGSKRVSSNPPTTRRRPPDLTGIGDIKSFGSPPGSASLLSRAPPRSASLLSREPPRSAFALSREPLRSTSALSREPPRSAFMLSQEPPRSASALSREPPKSASVLYREPPSSAFVLSQEPLRSESVLSPDGSVSTSSSQSRLKPLRLSMLLHSSAPSLPSSSIPPSATEYALSPTATVSSEYSLSNNPLLATVQSTHIPEHIRNTPNSTHVPDSVPHSLESSPIAPFFDPHSSSQTWHTQSNNASPWHRPAHLDTQPRSQSALSAPYSRAYSHNHVSGEDVTIRRPLVPTNLNRMSRPISVLRSPVHAIATPRPTLLFAIASDDVDEVRRVLESGEAGPNDDVGPQSALEFTLSASQLNHKMEIVKLLLAHGADPSVLKRSDTNSILSPNSDGHISDLVEQMDPATRYFMARAQAPQTRKASALVHRSFFRPLVRVHYDLIGQDRALEQMFRALSMPSMAPLVVIFCGPSGHGKSLLARKFGSLLDVPTHTVNMTTLRSTHDIWRSYSMSPYETPSGCTLADFLIDNEGKRCVVVLDEMEKTQDEKVLSSLLMPWELGRCSFEAGVRHVDVSNVIWLGTSNVGHDLVFEHQESRADPDTVMSREEYVELMGMIRPVMSERLGPSLLSRVTTVLPFVPFTAEEKMALAAEAMHALTGESEIPMTPAQVERIGRKAFTGYLPNEGARSLYRSVSMQLLDEM